MKQALANPFGTAAFALREEWRPFPDFEGLYEISSLGRVRSLQSRTFGKIKAWSKDSGGYPTVGLSKGGKFHAKTLHRAVCRAFHGEPKSADLQAAHLDGDKHNPSASNIAWCTKTENYSHKWIHGTHPSGCKNPRAKLTDEKVLEALAQVAAGRPRIEIAADYGVAAATLGKIVQGKTWRHLPRPSGPIFADVREAALDLINAAETLREQTTQTLVIRDAWDREREARSQRYFAEKYNG